MWWVYTSLVPELGVGEGGHKAFTIRLGRITPYLSALFFFHQNSHLSCLRAFVHPFPLHRLFTPILIPNSDFCSSFRLQFWGCLPWGVFTPYNPPPWPGSCGCLFFFLCHLLVHSHHHHHSPCSQGLHLARQSLRNFTRINSGDLPQQPWGQISFLPVLQIGLCLREAKWLVYCMGNQV